MLQWIICRINICNITCSRQELDIIDPFRPGFSIQIFTHSKSRIATVTHSFKWIKILTWIQFESNPIHVNGLMQRFVQRFWRLKWIPALKGLTHFVRLTDQPSDQIKYCMITARLNKQRHYSAGGRSAKQPNYVKYCITS